MCYHRPQWTKVNTFLFKNSKVFTHYWFLNTNHKVNIKVCHWVLTPEMMFFCNLQYLRYSSCLLDFLFQLQLFTAKRIWDSSILSSIKPKYERRLFVYFCVFPRIYLFCAENCYGHSSCLVDFFRLQWIKVQIRLKAWLYCDF